MPSGDSQEMGMKGPVIVSAGPLLTEIRLILPTVEHVVTVYKTEVSLSPLTTDWFSTVVIECYCVRLIMLIRLVLTTPWT